MAWKPCPIEGLTRKQYVALLNKQIRAILKDDFDEFARLAGVGDVGEVNGTHRRAWAGSGEYRKSIFAFLPHEGKATGCNDCATQIEHNRPEKRPSKQTHPRGFEAWNMWKKIEPGMLCSLPEMDSVTTDWEGFRFTRAQLKECARRQVVVRYGEEE